MSSLFFHVDVIIIPDFVEQSYLVLCSVQMAAKWRSRSCFVLVIAIIMCAVHSGQDQ